MSIRADYRMLSKLRRFIATVGAELGLDKPALDALTLAVDEAATNIIEHAVRDRPHEITCRCMEDGSRQEVVCVLGYDANGPFQPAALPSREEISERLRSLQPGGLGVYLVHSLVDGVEYGREGTTNVIVLRKQKRLG